MYVQIASVNAIIYKDLKRAIQDLRAKGKQIVRVSCVLHAGSRVLS